MLDRQKNPAGILRPGEAGGSNQQLQQQGGNAAGGPGGMGKKSNSTSQLSAAGKNEYPHRKFIECTFCRL